MVNLGNVQNGISRFVENEILAKVNGWQKWVAGTVVGIYIAKSPAIFNELKSNPFVKTLGVVDEHDMINVEAIYSELKKQASKGPVTFEVPMLGAMTIDGQDVEKLYRYIIGG